MATNKRVSTGKIGTGTNRCECTDCGETFNSVYAFDKHRTFEDPKVSDWEHRRCMTPAEMRAKGMDLNAGGYWVTALYEREEGVA